MAGNVTIEGGNFSFTGERLKVDSSAAGSTVSTVNGSVVNLGGGAAYNGAYELGTDASEVIVHLLADVDSAANGLTITFSDDGVIDGRVFPFFHDASVSNGQYYTAPVIAEYFKIDYVNGAAPTTVFRLETLRKGTPAEEKNQIDQAPTDKTLVSNRKSVITGASLADGVYRNAEVTAANELTVKPTETGKLQYIRDSVLTDVEEDTGTPANNRPLPVKLQDFSGDMVLNAGNLHLEVQLNHAGATPDSVRIGDGTETANVTAANKLETEPDGNVADNAADAGNPIKVGAIYEAALPTYGDGDRTTIHTDVNGRLMTSDISVAGGTVADNAVDSGDPVKAGSRVSDETDAYTVGDRADLLSNTGGFLLVEPIQPTHDDFNANANMQVGNADVANGNPVPVSDAGGTLTIDQATHDNLNANANMQVGDVDVANGNPVPISDAGGTITIDQATHDNLNANANIQVGDADVAVGNPVPVSGTVAHNAADSGNPIKIGAIYRAALTTLDDADRSDLHTNVNGRLLTEDETLNAKITSFDLDTGAGTEENAGVSLRGSANGGSVELGTTTNPLRTQATGSTSVETIRNDYSSTPVTTAAWVQLDASTAAEINYLDIFDSSGETLEFGTGAAASEVRQFYIAPGGNGRIDINIPAGTRLAVKAVSADATVGEILVNAFS